MRAGVSLYRGNLHASVCGCRLTQPFPDHDNAGVMRGNPLHTYPARLMALWSILLFSAAAADIGQSGRIAVVSTPNGGHPVDARMDAAGTIHLLYDSGDIPYYVRSVDYGATFSAAIPVVGKESRK